jgi:uncharacterized membrane protein YbhN (UPF0104 family)
VKLSRLEKTGQKAEGKAGEVADAEAQAIVEAQTANGRPISPWFLLAKLGLVVGGLVFLLRWAVESLPGDDLSISPLAVIGAILLNQAALLMAALRLRATLRAFGVAIGRRDAFRIHLQSLFYFFFVPLSVGLEAARFVKIRRIEPRVPTKQLLLALLVDRVLGLVAAVAVVGALLYLVAPQLVPGHCESLCQALAAGAVAIGLAALLLSSRVRAVFRDIVGAILSRGYQILVLLVLSLLALLLVCASVFFVAIGADIQVGVTEVTFAISASLLGMVLPLSLLGVTAGEAAGAGIFTLLGVSPAASVLLVSAAYLGRLLGAMQGALLELSVGGRDSHRRRGGGGA